MKVRKRNKTHINTLTVLLTVLTALSVSMACSTTSNLPEGEILYTGIDRININDKETVDEAAEAFALEEVNAALAFAPNNSFMGSSSVRLPLPIGLWVYNGLLDNHEKGLSKWLFNNFSSTPVTLESVAPETRVKVATNTLQNYGYFQGKVDYRLVDQKDPKKKKIEYNIHLGKPYTFDSITYVFPEKIDSIRKATSSKSLIHKDDQFNAANLQVEKERIVNNLRNNGYYYYRPDYISYYADSMMTPQKVKLLVVQDAQTPEIAKRQWFNGKTSVYIRNATSSAPALIGGDSRRPYSDSLVYRNTTFYFSGNKCPISPRVLMRNFRFRKGRPFSQEKVDETVTNLSNMQIFSQMQFAFTPRDTTGLADTLDLRLNCTMDKLIDAELNFDITQKSNAQVGPRLALMISKRNAFGHGETFSVKAKGSYEWQTKATNDQKRIDSYEAGLDASLTYPWLVLPGLSTKRFRYATSSTFKIGFDHLKRAGYYKLLSFQATADYNFRTNQYYSHRLTPLSLVYNKLEETTTRFDSIADNNQSLFYSLRDQFIPSVGYSITYDNNWNENLDFTTKAELAIKESGNLISGISSLFGSDFSQEDKKLINVPYAQFVKASLDIRHIFRLKTNSLIATRFLCGAIWAYGNSYIPPYTEQFFVGGANDIRAFGAHTIGPGSYYDYAGRGTYLDQSGSLKLELNAEYRFPIVSNLHGALFLDAGNVWTLKNLSSHPGGQIKMSRLLDDIATGTGFGLRYNLDVVVLRLDMGIALHAPYDTGKSGYYNIRTFWKDGVGLHFAVGYPF